MDSLTAAIALVIDNDQGELERACDLVRAAEEFYDGAEEGESNGQTREGFVLSHVAGELQDQVPSAGAYAYCMPHPHRLYADVAISHMYTHTDWRALAQHYMAKVAEGVK